MDNIKLQAEMKTSKGTIHINLWPELAPLTVLNFANLSKRGYYDGLKYHRVISDFMIQGGCPQGTGTGGPGYNFKDEIHHENTFNRPGLLAMANAGPGTNGSQFFITHVETPHLNNNHTIFGEVVSEEDQAVVDAVRQGDIIESVTITGDVEEFFEMNKEILDQLNEALAAGFPNLKK